MDYFKYHEGYPSTPCGQPPLKSKEGEEGKAWAYGKGWPWTTASIARAYHVLPMYDLRAATKRREGCKGEEEREERRGRLGRMAKGGLGLLQVSLGPTMSYPCTTYG
jgi:hypothetical protein